MNKLLLHLLIYLSVIFLGFASNAQESISVSNVTASNSQGSNLPANTLDNDLGTRWGSNGIGEWIKYDLGELFSVSAVDLAFFRGNLGKYSFEIEVSVDDISYQTIFQGESDGNSNNFQSFAFSAINARYVKITGNGNNTTNTPNYNAITETVIIGESLGNQPPVAVVNSSQNTGPAPLAINFDGTASSDPEGGLLTFSWVFGDGSTGSGSTISHTFSEGSYNVLLTVTDNNNNSASASLEIIAYGLEPIMATGLSLINAETNQELRIIEDNEVINLSSLPTKKINFKANVSPEEIGSVLFDVNGNTAFRSDNTAPYSLAGDNNGNYHAYTPPVGNYVVVVRPFLGIDGTGTAGTDASISFSIIDEPNSAPVLAPIGNQTVIEGEVLNVPLSASDPDGDPLTFSLSTMADFIAVTDNGDGTAKLAISPGTSSAGDYQVAISVEDGKGGVVSETFTVGVDAKPVLVATPPDDLVQNRPTDNANPY